MKINNKRILLAIVALVLVVLVSVGVTYSWIDDVKLVEFDNTTLTDNDAPLKTGVDINSTVNITRRNNSIDLGNMIYMAEGDDNAAENAKYLTYKESNDENSKRHIKYDQVEPTDAEKVPDRNTIDQKKGYFYESGDMHMSPCYSDGESFYFPMQGGQSGYREGNKDDENVNYISFTFKVSSPDANVDFWFDGVPSVKLSGDNGSLAGARYAIVVDGKSHIYSSTGSALTCTDNLLSTTSVPEVRKTSEYAYSDESNLNHQNTLFSIKKGDTVNLNVKIWLECSADYNNVSAVDVDLKLISSWAFSRTITIVDKTTSNVRSSWMKDANAKLYFTCPNLCEAEALKYEGDSGPSHWDQIPDYYESLNINYPPFVHITPTSTDETTGTYDYYSVTVPYVYNGEEMIIYRCSSSGFNHGNTYTTEGNHGVKYYNWWKTTIPKTYTNATYTIYGGSHDRYAADIASDDNKKNTYLGYGTWGEVERITVKTKYQETGGSEHLFAQGGASNDNLYIKDFSDKQTSGEVYVHTMCWDGTNKQWNAFIPKSSALLQFLYTQSGVVKRYWGYNSWGEDCPQQRPIKSEVYASNSLVYQLADQETNGEGNVNKGRGYWVGADVVYLIKNGAIAEVPDANVRTKMVDGDHKVDNDAARESTDSMTVLMDSSDNTKAVKFRNTTTVLKSVSVKHTEAIYKDVHFMDTDENPTSGSRVLYPGCFYNYAEQKWYGSLRDIGRAASAGSEDSGGGQSSDIETGDMTGYDTESSFTFQIGSQPYTAYMNKSTDASDTLFKVQITLAVGVNWVTVQKSGVGYGLDKTGQTFSISDFNGIYITNADGRNKNFAFRALESGNYIVSFKYDNGNMGTIKLETIQKAS